jgi:hypothetical protein
LSPLPTTEIFASRHTVVLILGQEPFLAQLHISDGNDANKIEKDVHDLISLGWKVDNERMELEASFTFPTFAKAAVRLFDFTLFRDQLILNQDFMILVFIQSKALNHHSETYNVRFSSVTQDRGADGR